MAILERLAKQDPDNAQLQLDLAVQYYKGAHLLYGYLPTIDDAGISWARKAYEKLSGLKKRGMHLSQEHEEALSWLKEKMKGG